MTDLDFDGLVEMACRGVYGSTWDGPPDKMPGPEMKAVWRKHVGKAVRAVLPHVLAGPREALGPFALIAEHDVGDTEADRDRFKPMFTFNRAPWIIIGDLRRARSELARIDKLTEGLSREGETG